MNRNQKLFFSCTLLCLIVFLACICGCTSDGNIISGESQEFGKNTRSLSAEQIVKLLPEKISSVEYMNSKTLQDYFDYKPDRNKKLFDYIGIDISENPVDFILNSIQVSLIKFQDSQKFISELKLEKDNEYNGFNIISEDNGYTIAWNNDGYCIIGSKAFVLEMIDNFNGNSNSFTKDSEILQFAKYLGDADSFIISIHDDEYTGHKVTGASLNFNGKYPEYKMAAIYSDEIPNEEKINNILNKMRSYFYYNKYDEILADIHYSENGNILEINGHLNLDSIKNDSGKSLSNGEKISVSSSFVTYCIGYYF